MSAVDPRSGSAKLGMVLAMWAERQADAPAMISAAGDRSFAELNTNVNRLARGLASRGAREGTSVALLCSNRPEFVETFAATQRSGQRVTPVNWHFTGAEAGYIVDDCDAEVLVADARFADTAVGAAARAPRATIRVSVGGEIPGFEPYESVLREESGEDLSDPMLGSQMMYTSGTTGQPKGVRRDRLAPQSQTVVQLVPVADYRAGEDAHLCTGPLYHAAPLNFSITAPLSEGVGVVLMDGWDAEQALSLMERHGVTHSHMVPTMFRRLLAVPPDVRARADVSSLRFVIHGAAPCPIGVKHEMIEWWGPVLHEYYAATEGVGAIVDSADWLARPGTVGRPATPDHVRVLDSDGRDLGPDEVGTLYIKAPTRGRFSYHKADDKTADTYRDDWYTLGDLGYLDADGWLFLTDRSVDLISSGGVNIYPAEVEAVLHTHPAVADVAVIGVPSAGDLGEDVLAVVEPQPRLRADATQALATDLIEYCRERLAHYKCPRTVEFLEDLPRTETGKVMRTELRAEHRGQMT